MGEGGAGQHPPPTHQGGQEVMTANLRLIAEDRVDRPLSEWPDHNKNHTRTLAGDFLQDFHCLRCWLEEVATERLIQEDKK